MISEYRSNIRFVVLACLIVAGLVAALFYKNTYVLTLMCQIMFYFIAATGLNFVSGLIGQANLGMAGIFSIGAYTSALMSMNMGLSPWLCIPIVLSVGWLVGKLLGYPSLRVEGIYLSLTTMVFTELVRNLLTNAASFSGGAAGLKSIPTYELFGLDTGRPANMLFILIIIAIPIVYVSDRIIRSRWGRSFAAIRDNVEAVSSCGINVAGMKVTAYTLSTIFGALAGALYAHFNTYLNPVIYDARLSTSFNVMVIMGGIGTVSGCFIGSLLVCVLPELLRFLGIYYQFAYSMIALLSILFLPGGLVQIFIGKRTSVTAKSILQIFIGKEKDPE